MENAIELKSSLLLKEMSHVIADDEMTQKVIDYIRKLRRDKSRQLKLKSLAPLGISQKELVQRAERGIASDEVLSQADMLKRKPQQWK
ncbi:hypothetical protein [Bacteroides sp.]